MLVPSAECRFVAASEVVLKMSGILGRGPLGPTDVSCEAKTPVFGDFLQHDCVERHKYVV